MTGISSNVRELISVSSYSLISSITINIRRKYEANYKKDVGYRRN